MLCVDVVKVVKIIYIFYKFGYIEEPFQKSKKILILTLKLLLLTVKFLIKYAGHGNLLNYTFGLLAEIRDLIFERPKVHIVYFVEIQLYLYRNNKCSTLILLIIFICIISFVYCSSMYIYCSIELNISTLIHKYKLIWLFIFIK